MKKNILLSLILALSFSSYAQNTKRGFKSLEKGDYGKAMEVFNKVLSEDSENVVASFGKALIMADDNSPLFDIVSSYKYILVVKGKENSLSQDEIEFLKEYFLATEVRKTSYPVKKKIKNAEEAIDARLIKYIREENDLEAIYRILEEYPNYIHRDNVIHIRNQFEYRKFEKINTFDSYKEFIEKFPEAAQIVKAENNRNKLAFEKTKALNTVAAYNDYINKYPDSKYFQQAIIKRNAKAFANAESTNTLEAYQQFIRLYPDALEISMAQKHQHQLMYEKAKRIKSLEAYNEFIKMYPNGAYYLDVFNLKSSDLGMHNFNSLGLNKSKLVYAKSLDNNEQIELGSSLVETPDGGLIVAGTTQLSDTSFSDAWVVKLDAKGNMEWNKTIGQPYNDSVLEVFVTSAGDYIVLGYTQIASDSAKYMGWMFKLGKDGGKIWNKNLGDLNIAAVTKAPNDKIYVSSFIDDTIPDNYYIEAYNMEGRKVWEKDYVFKGIFNDIDFRNNGDVFLAGSRWFTLSDPKFYIKWEDSLKVTGHVQKAAIGNQNIFMVSNDSVNNYLLGYSLSGNKKWTNTITRIEKTESIVETVMDNSENGILAIKRNLNTSVYQYDSSGKKVAEKDFMGEYQPIKILPLSSGKIAYLFRGKDYLVTVFSGPAF